MRSPFPGMDPYLEDPAFWQDFHRSFITYCRDALLDKLPDAYEARIDEQLRLVTHESDRVEVRLPDVTITHDASRSPARGGGASAAAVATLEPVANQFVVTVEETRDSWIEIIHRPERSLVTAIEVLSPTNKQGNGFQDYFAKRSAILDRGAHLVELDLLIGGRRLPLRNPLQPGDYYAYVTREERRPSIDVYAWSIRDPLPTIPIPLKAPDPDIGLNIAEVFAITYERGRYARSLAYHADAPAPLSTDVHAWARERAAEIRR